MISDIDHMSNNYLTRSQSVLRSFVLILASFYSFALLAEETQYMPKAKHVTANVYAFIGPLGQRSEKNDGLNNNLGFIVANKGVILIDSGASRMAA